MKGKTKIELTDVNTGKTEVHEDENMFTNALSEIYDNNYLRFGVVSSSGFFGTLIRDLSSYESVIGGVYCMDTKLDEDASIIEVPDGVTVTAHAGSAYTGNSTTRGSWNSTESGLVDNGYKFVWDFATNQGNGTIKSVGLTTSYGGNCGGDDFGYNDGTVLQTAISTYATGQRITDADGNYLSAYGMDAYIDDDFCIWCKKVSSTTSVTVYKSSKPYPIKAPNLYNYELNSVIHPFILDESVTITLPVAVNTNIYNSRIVVDGDSVYLIARANSSSNGLYVFDLDFSNGAVNTYYNISNSIITRTSLVGLATFITGGYLYYITSDYYIEKINFKTANIILTSSAINYGGYYTNAIVGVDYSGRLLVAASTSSSSSSYYYYYYYYYWDEENNEVHKMGDVRPGSSKDDGSCNDFQMEKWVSPYYKLCLHSDTSTNSSNNWWYMNFVANKPLITINNLSSTVTKTSAQTMKITYTVTES